MGCGRPFEMVQQPWRKLSLSGKEILSVASGVGSVGTQPEELAVLGSCGNSISVEWGH